MLSLIIHPTPIIYCPNKKKKYIYTRKIATRQYKLNLCSEIFIFIFLYLMSLGKQIMVSFKNPITQPSICFGGGALVGLAQNQPRACLSVPTLHCSSSSVYKHHQFYCSYIYIYSQLSFSLLYLSQDRRQKERKKDSIASFNSRPCFACSVVSITNMVVSLILN